MTQQRIVKRTTVGSQEDTALHLRSPSGRTLPL
jgi:hypothetical protein